MTDHDELEEDPEARLSDADLEALAARRAARAPRDKAGYKRTGAVTTAQPAGDGEMPCRRCRVPVPVSESTVAQFNAFNAYLQRKGQAPTPPDQVVACDACREEEERKRAAAHLEVVEGMAAAVRVLKAGIGAEVTAAKYRQAERYLNEHDNEREGSGKRESRTVIYWRAQHARKGGARAREDF